MIELHKFINCAVLIHTEPTENLCLLGDLLNYTVEKIERISSLEKNLFWTKPQFKILNDQSKKRIIFMSDFGTGKTTLIKTKAKQLLMEGKEVIFISFEDSETNGDSLLFMALRSEFGNLVYSLRGSGNC